VALDDVETPHGRAENVLGGSAVYFSLAANFFTDVHVVGVVGPDFPGEHIAFLTAKGIDTRGIQTVPGKTFRWSGAYTGDMAQAETREVELGVFGDFRPELPEAYRSLPVVFLANASPHTQMAVIEQMDAPRFIAADTMNLWIETERGALEELIGRVDCLFINDGEARMLRGEENLIRCGQEIREMGPSRVVIKKGEHGAILMTGDGAVPLPAYPTASVVDPTGAGDSFAGGFMGATASEAPDESGRVGRALALGTVVASFTVGRFGVAGLDEIDRSRVEERYERFRQMLGRC
jgi:sugar/nucleoside kinase (ribokinase family)